VTAIGTPPLSYEWRRNGTPIGGGGGATYITSAVALTDDGSSYTVLVSNSTGSVLSTVAKLSVREKTSEVSTQPQNTVVTARKDASFHFTETSVFPISSRDLSAPPHEGPSIYEAARTCRCGAYRSHVRGTPRATIHATNH
jgi:hypothetical protein